MRAPRSLPGLRRWLWRWRAAGIVLRQLGNVLKLLLQEVHRLGVAHILLPAQQAERAPVVMMSLHLWRCIAVADRSRASRAASVQRAGAAKRAEGVTVRTLLHGVTVNPPLTQQRPALSSSQLPTATAVHAQTSGSSTGLSRVRGVCQQWAQWARGWGRTGGQGSASSPRVRARWLMRPRTAAAERARRRCLRGTRGSGEVRWGAH